MKNFALYFLAIFSINSFANNMVGINYNDFAIDVEDGVSASIDGFGVSLSGINKSIIYDFDLTRFSGAGESLTLNMTHIGYAFGDLDQGSFYLGIVSSDSNAEDSDRSTDAEVGYARRGNNGIQYKVGILTGDFDESVDVEVQIPVQGGNLELGVLVDSGDRWLTVGYAWNF